MTIHESTIARMQATGMVPVAADALRRAIAEAEDELAETRKDIDLQLARIGDDQDYANHLDQQIRELRGRLAQIEAVPS